MVTGVKKDYGSIAYMRFKKHECPDCQGPTFLRKVKRKVKSNSKAAQNYDFKVGDTTLSGTVKFIWYEFKCKNCGNQYTEAQMKQYEAEKKATEKAQKKAEKKAQKKAEREEKRANSPEVNINITINK